MLERSDEDFAIRAGSQMSTYLPTDIGRELVVDVGGQLPEKIYATALTMRMALRR
jgi:hypothetical protein